MSVRKGTLLHILKILPQGIDLIKCNSFVTRCSRKPKGNLTLSELSS